MNLEEYQKAAERTMTDPDNIGRMQNAALGLCGEASELAEIVGGVAPILEECGDLLWYVAQMCKALNFSIADIPPLDFNYDEANAIRDIYAYAGKVADKIKKHVYHGKPINNVDLARDLQRIVTAVDALLGFDGKHVADACEYNNQKLLKRHPNGFTHTSANAYADRTVTS